MLDILGGGLRPVIARALGKLMQHGTLHVPTVSSDGKGGTVSDYANQAVQGFIETYSAGYRARAGIPDTDVKIMLLQHGVATPPTTDSQVSLQGRRYRVVGPVEQDPAGATWTMRGSPV